MDTSYRNKDKSGEKAVNSKKEQNRHISDDYNGKVKPRRTKFESENEDKRINQNLTKLNNEMVQNPVSGEKIVNKRRKTEDTGAKVVTKKAALKSPVPIPIILGSILITAVIMYTLSLYVKIEEYSISISKIENEISELQSRSEQLDGKLETKYDLSEIQRIATEEYGMVTADTLPKKYLNMTKNDDLGQSIENKENSESGLSKLLSGFATAIRGFLE